MAANTCDGAPLLMKKFGALVLIFFGILGIAVGLEYRSTGLSTGIIAAGIIAAGIVALVGGAGLLALKFVRRNAGGSAPASRAVGLAGLPPPGARNERGPPIEALPRLGGDLLLSAQSCYVMVRRVSRGRQW